MSERVENKNQEPQKTQEPLIPQQQRSPLAEETTGSLPILRTVREHFLAERKSHGTGRHRAGAQHASNEIQRNPTGLPPKHAAPEETYDTTEPAQTTPPTEITQPLPPVEERSAERAAKTLYTPSEATGPSDADTQEMSTIKVDLPDGSKANPFVGEIVEKDNPEEPKKPTQPEPEKIIDVKEATRGGAHKRTNLLVSFLQGLFNPNTSPTEVVVREPNENAEKNPPTMKVTSVDERTIPTDKA